MKVVRKDGKKLDDSPIHILTVTNKIYKFFYKIIVIIYCLDPAK
jgi:hypothetical protein